MKHHRTPFGRIERYSDKPRPGPRGRSGAGRKQASVRLQRQHRAFATEIMCTLTARYKNIELPGAVKYPTERRHRAARVGDLPFFARSLGSWSFRRAESGCLLYMPGVRRLRLVEGAAASLAEERDNSLWSESALRCLDYRFHGEVELWVGKGQGRVSMRRSEINNLLSIYRLLCKTPG
jgi:hypothetical protein